jgi:hypothetical protein
MFPFQMAGDTGKGNGEGILSRFGFGGSSSRSQSGGSGGQAGPSRAARSQESDASGYRTTMPTRAGRSPTTTRMSVRMPAEDRFGIPNHLLDMVRILGYVELSDDTTTKSGAAAADAGEHLDGHPLSPWVSDDDHPMEHQDKHDAIPEDEDPKPAPDSPDELVPMEFEIDDVPRQPREARPSRGRRLVHREGPILTDPYLRPGETYRSRRMACREHDALWHSMEDEQQRRRSTYRPSPHVYSHLTRVAYPHLVTYPMSMYLHAPLYAQAPMLRRRFIPIRH